jgi:hypothetical protein
MHLGGSPGEFVIGPTIVVLLLNGGALWVSS